MADMEQLKTALRNAHNAGDVDAARRIAAMITASTPQAAGPFSLEGGSHAAAGPFSVPSGMPKWQQAPEVPKWQQAPEVAEPVSGKAGGGTVTLTIEGRKVEVSPNFLSLSPEEQNRTVDEISQSLGIAPQAYTESQLKEAARKALAAGDNAAAKRLVDAARKAGTQNEPSATSTVPPEELGPWNGYRAKAEAQAAALEAARARLADGATAPSFSAEQQAAIERAQARLAASNAPAAKTGPDSVMPFKMSAANPVGILPVPKTDALPPLMAPSAPGFRNPATGQMSGMGRYVPGRMTMDEALSSLSDTWQKGEVQAPLSQGRAAVVGGAQGATFGFADEIVGGLLALHPRIDYDNAVDYLRGELDDAREFYPKTTLAGEVGGSIAVPAKAAASFINKGVSTGGRMLRGALAGGTSSAVYGYGSGEGGAAERALNALETGSLGALGGGALVGLGQGFNKLLGMVSKRPELRELAPTLEGLRAEASRLYTEARESGATLPASALSDMVSGIQSKLRQSGFDPDLHPRVKAVLNRLQSETGDKTLAEIEILRRVAGNAAEGFAPDEKRLAGMIIDQIDDTIDALPEGGEALRAARETWGRLRRMELIDAALDRASLAKADFATALQSEFRALSKSARKLRGFSEAERAAIRSIAKGGPLTTGLQALGNALTPNRTLGALLTGGAAYNFGLGGVAVPAAGFASRKIAEALSHRAGQQLRDNVGRSDASRQVIAELLRRPNPLASGVPAAGVAGAYPGRE